MTSEYTRMMRLTGQQPTPLMTLPPLGRRGFLTGVAGLVVAAAMPPLRVAAQGAATAADAAPILPGAFIRVAPDGTVTVLSRAIEMGQGPYTGLATLAAEEMDADWSQVRAEGAPAEDVYIIPAMGIQMTGGSNTIATSYLQMRRAGAAARQMLVEAAAEAWGVDPAQITVAKGRIRHEASGNEDGFGPFAEAASRREVPLDPRLKDPSDFTLIGNADLRRLDTAGKSDGTAVFAMDIHHDDMLTVVVARPPKFGATVARFDDTAALQVPGVDMVRQIPFGIAVYARDTWAAMQGRRALDIEWDETAAETRSSAALLDEFAAAAAAGGVVAEESGDIAAIDGAAQIIEAEYRFPYLAHSPMEPLDGVIVLRDGKAQLTYGCQFPTMDRLRAAAVLGLPHEDVRIDVILAGGGFGRRASGNSEIADEIASVARAAGRDGAYKIVWTREDDLRGGYYRPLTVHRMRAGIDDQGRIVGWENTIANQSIMSGTPLEAMMQGGLDATSYEGSNNLPYDLGARRIAWAKMTAGVPILWWRSVGHTHTAYAVETFLDEVLQAAGKDPIQGRLDILSADAVRERAVIERVAQVADWQGATRTDAPGTAWGFAWAKSFGTYAAQVAQIEDRGGMPHVVKVWCVVDCGRVVNPDVVAAQIEGGIGFGLGAALYSQITLADGGTVVEGNWDSYQMLRMDSMPQVQVVMMDSDADPTGVGEPGVPPIAPAVANAWRALTGQAVRQLPFNRNLTA